VGVVGRGLIKGGKGGCDVGRGRRGSRGEWGEEKRGEGRWVRWGEMR